MTINPFRRRREKRKAQQMRARAEALRDYWEKEYREYERELFWGKK